MQNNTYQTQILAQAEFQWKECPTYLLIDEKLHHVATYKWWDANLGAREPLCPHQEPPSSVA